MSMRSALRKTTVVQAGLIQKDAQRPVLLAVGEMSGWHMRGDGLPQDSAITFIEFRELTAELLEALTPDIILSPLMCSSFDCMDLAQMLEGLGFAGRYRAIDSQIPQPDLIRREVQDLCPQLDFDLVSIDMAAWQR